MWGLIMIPVAIAFAIFSAKVSAHVFFGQWRLSLWLFAARTQNAAMRGTKRKPFPEWVDKVFRTTFLVMFVSPMYLYMSWLIPGWLQLLLLVAYLPSYLDGSERFKGRPSEGLTEIKSLSVVPKPGGKGFSGPVGFYLQAGGDASKLPKAA